MGDAGTDELRAARRRIGARIDAEADQHRAERVGIGGGAGREFALGERLSRGEGREDDELVGGDAGASEVGIAGAVHGEVGAAEGQGEVVTEHRGAGAGEEMTYTY